MKRIPIKPEHMHMVNKYAALAEEDIKAMDNAENRTELEKARKRMADNGREFWDYMKPRYGLTKVRANFGLVEDLRLNQYFITVAKSHSEVKFLNALEKVSQEKISKDELYKSPFTDLFGSLTSHLGNRSGV